MRPVPAERWNSGGDACAGSGRVAGCLDASFPAGFDAAFFDVSPAEARGLDPQQRLLLEVCWHALEDAGLTPNSRPDPESGAADIGVYVGISTSDYQGGQIWHPDRGAADPFTATGVSFSTAAGRISYTFGLEGPSMAVDTACSSSLVALHLACQAVRNQECGAALVAGVNALLAPNLFVGLDRLGVLSVEGRCKAFDASGDGYVRAEGAGALVVTTLSRARAWGCRVLALVRGSAVNQDGKSNGLTAPNGLAQERVIERALATAGLSPAAIGYVEAHGTGTPLGDVVEMAALAATYGIDRDPARPLLIGSVKTNIGHLEAAAGIASVIKVIQCLRHGEIPGHLHLRTPSPHIPWDRYPFRVPTSLTAWPAGDGPRRAGVSSFGFSGTNAHVILEEAPAAARESGGRVPAFRVLALSARSGEALGELAGRHVEFLEGSTERLADICHMAGAGRGHFGHRLAVVGTTGPEMAAALRRHLRGEEVRAVAAGGGGSGRPRIGFLFTGQGSQYVGMGRGLYEEEPVFRAAMDACDAILRGRLDEPLVSLLYGAGASEERLQQTGHAQPAIFAVEYALYELWRSWGVRPDVVAGHSIGEFVAAHVAGVLGLEDALRLVAERGRLMQELPAGGAMAAVFAPEAVVAAAVASAVALGAAVSVAAVNTPEDVVIAGPAEAIADLCRDFEARGHRTQELRVSHAFHSPLMRPMVGAFAEIAATVSYRPARLPMVSTVSGRKAEGGDLAGAAYWSAQIEAPVRFAAAATTLADDGVTVFLEIGAAPILTALARRTVAAEGRHFLPSLTRPAADGGADDQRALAGSLAALYAQGADIDWAGRDRPFDLRKVAIPTYPFQRKSYYLKPVADAGGVPAVRGHPWLGQKIVSPLIPRDNVLYQAHFTAEQPSFLREHKIFGRIISPAAAHLSMAFSAVRELIGARPSQLDDVAFTAPLVVDDDEPRTVQMILEGGKGPDGGFRLVSRAADAADAPWQTHCTGRIAPQPPRASSGDVDFTDFDARCSGRMAHDAFYALIEAAGYSTGPSFRCLRDIQQGEDESWCRLEAPGRIDDGAIHPGLIDSILQTVLPACEKSAAEMLTGDSVLIPLHMGSVRLLGSLAGPLYCHTCISVAPGMVKATVKAYAADGVPALEIDDFLLKQTDRATLYQQMRRDDRSLLHSFVWNEIAALSPSAIAPAGTTGWVVFTDARGWGASLIEGLRAQEVGCLEMRLGDRFERLGADQYQVDLSGTPPDHEKLAGLLADWASEARFAAIRVVLCAADEPGGGGDDTADIVIDSLESAHEKWCGGLLHMVQALGRQPLPKPTRLWIVTQQAQKVVREDWSTPSAILAGGALWAFARTVSHEFPELWGGLVDVEAEVSERGVAALAAVLGGTGPEALAHEDHLALRQGDRVFAARLVAAPAPNAAATVGPVPHVSETEAYFLDVGPRHTLDDMAFKIRPRRAPEDHEVEIAIVAAGLNFRDVLNALGQYPGDAGLLGFEAAGTVVRRGQAVTDLGEGDAVVVLAAPGCIGSYVTVDRTLVVPKPKRMSFAEAVTLPVAFLTAHYALNVLGRMRKGDRVLIHAAAGGVGLAAVQLAKRVGAEIFATVGSPEKREYLKSLGVTHLLNSRSTDFAAEIQDATGGRGVDIVLNSLSGEFITASFSVLARGGRFLEIGKIGIWDSARVAELDPTIFYRPLDLSEVAREDPAQNAAMFNDLMPLFESGELSPLPVTEFPLHRAEDGFRYMAQARHIGKIVLSRDGEDRRELMGRRGPVAADASYLVTGGLGALGLRVAQWLHDEGARHLVLVGRNAPSHHAEAIITTLRQDGATVQTVRADISVAADVGRVLDQVDASMPPLKGVIHAAGLLDDGMIADLTWPRFSLVMAPKVRGAWNLHQATRDRNLDFFVLFSSVAAVIGNLGQGNYAAANGFMDGLAALRRQFSLPATSINWGPWAESGMAAATSGERFSAMGIRGLNPDQALRVLKHVIKEDLVQPIVVDADWPALAASQGLDTGSGLYAVLTSSTDAAARLETAATTGRNILDELRSILPVERPVLLRAYLQELARQTLGYGEGETIELDQPLVAQGFDSLMSVDMRNRLNRSLGQTLPASLLFDYPTLEKIAAFLLDDVIQLDAEAETPAADSTPAQSAQALLREIEDLTALS